MPTLRVNTSCSLYIGSHSQEFDVRTSNCSVGLSNNHVGNKWYLDIVENRKAPYHTSSNRTKDAIVDEIVRLVRGRNPTGHFLRFDSKAKVWRDVGDVAAHGKVSRALRETKNEPRGPPSIATLKAEEIAPKSLNVQTIVPKPNTDFLLGRGGA